MGLAACERLFGSKILEIGMIQEDLSKVEIALKIVVKMVESVDDSQ